MCFSAAPSQARSCASVAVAASTSDAAPVACAARSRSRSATALAAAAKRAVLRRAIGLVDFGRRLGLIEYRMPAGPDHWAVLDAGDNRNAMQNRASRNVGGLAIRGQ